MNEQATVLTVEQKLAILNGLKVVEVDQRAEDEISIFVADDETTVSALLQVGLSDSDIVSTYVDGEVRDIAVIGCQIGADYYDPKVGGWGLWTVEEKLDMLNELEVVDHDGDGDACFYVLVEKNDKALNVIDALGIEVEDLLHKEAGEDDLVDISKVAWKIGATWWDGNKFLVEKPEPGDGDELAKIQRTYEQEHINWLDLLNAANVNFGLSHEGISYHSTADLEKARQIAKEHGMEHMLEDDPIDPQSMNKCKCGMLIAKPAEICAECEEDDLAGA